MNRRVLAGLVAMARVHEAKESPNATDRSMNRAYGCAGIVQLAMSDDDYALYERLGQLLCAEEETLQDDPVGAALLTAVCADTLPEQVSDPESEKYIVPRAQKEAP